MKYIEGYEGLYKITEDGKVLSTPSDGKPSRELKQEIMNSGYARVALSKKGKVTKSTVHRLVASAYIPNPENKSTVNHIDNDTTNNTVSNLEWATQKENILHSTLQGRRKHVAKIGSIAAAQKAISKTEHKLMLMLHDPEYIRRIPPFTSKGKAEFRCICGKYFTKRVDAVKEGITCRTCSNRIRAEKMVKTKKRNKEMKNIPTEGGLE